MEIPNIKEWDENCENDKKLEGEREKCIKTKLNRACLSYQMKSIWHAMRLSSWLYISTVFAYFIFDSWWCHWI